MNLISKDCFLLFALGLAAFSSGCHCPSSNRKPTGCSAYGKASGPNPGLEVATLRSAQPSGSVNAFWNVDRQYLNTPTLTPHSRVTIAELRGPGVITLLRISQIPQVAKAGLLRGIMLEIYFDDAEDPAVLCPVPDFFGDGCNGKAIEFASRFMEKVPVAWNAYFPMSFKKSARVIFRNDTDLKTTAYAYLEWEKLPQWDPTLGYFHATYRRKGFFLTNDSREEFFHVNGRGHFLGRQFSVVSGEPTFRGFHIVMEGNNEVSVDGRAKAFDYLGSEDSFTFSRIHAVEKMPPIGD